MATVETLVLNAAREMSGSELIFFVEQEIASADEQFRRQSAKANARQLDAARQRRLRLGRLAFLLKHGVSPLGATCADQDLYSAIERLRDGRH